MALSYLERFQLVNDDSFWRRVQLALWVTSVGVLDENANTPDHANRLTRANRYLSGNVIGSDEKLLINTRLVANATVGDQGMDIADSALQNIVNNMFNQLPVN